MNLIKCDEQCIHQKDGLCTLETMDQISPYRNDACLYFKPSLLGSAIDKKTLES